MNDTCPDPRPNRADSVMEMVAEIERTTNNREMWKIQCERQAKELTRLRIGMMEIRKMAREGCDAPNAAYRWCERIDEATFAALKDISS